MPRMQMNSLIPLLCWLGLALCAGAEDALLTEMNEAVSDFDRMYGRPLQELANKVNAESQKLSRHPVEAGRWTALLKKESTRETFRQLRAKCTDAQRSREAIGLQAAMATLICRCVLEDRKASGPEIESELAFVQEFMNGLELRRRLLRAELGRDVMPSNYSSFSGCLSPEEADLNQKKWLHFMTVQAEEEIFDDLWRGYVQRLSLSPTEGWDSLCPML